MNEAIIRNAAIAITAAMSSNARLSRRASEREKDAAADATLNAMYRVLRNVWTDGYNTGAKDVEAATYKAIERISERHA